MVMGPPEGIGRSGEMDCMRWNVSEKEGMFKRNEKKKAETAVLLSGLYRSCQWCRGTESNCRHGDFQSPALPTELPRHRNRRNWLLGKSGKDGKENLSPGFRTQKNALSRKGQGVFNAVDGAEGQNRTADTGIFSPLLYRLSYLGTATDEEGI